jgi:hypothetical protein
MIVFAGTKNLAFAGSKPVATHQRKIRRPPPAIAPSLYLSVRIMYPALDHVPSAALIRILLPQGESNQRDPDMEFFAQSQTSQLPLAQHQQTPKAAGFRWTCNRV